MQTKRWLLAMIAAAPLAAWAASGEFTFVVGEVTVVKAGGQRITPAKGTPVDVGDRVVTGANGMAQLTMVDQARLSLRPSTQFLIEQYPETKEGAGSAVLNLLKGTLRTFTGLISSVNRDRFVMKTRVATVGIRGSGNILYACDGAECDPSVRQGNAEESLTVNHTIEGSHAVSNIVPGAAPGVPAQQGGAETLITGPGQTVLVAGGRPPRYIPTPSFIADVATNMTKANAGDDSAALAEARVFSPGDVLAILALQQTTVSNAGNNPTIFLPTVDATRNLVSDPSNLRDIVIAAGGAAFIGQAAGGDVTLAGGNFAGYRAYAGSGSGITPVIRGGTLRDATSVVVDGQAISLGRWENASLGFFGAGSGTQVPGSIHWVMAPSGYPTYLAEVLTGTASYTLAASTSPTNQDNVAGTLASANLSVNFTNRTVNLGLNVTLPAQGSTPAGSWQLNADSIPLALNTFFGSTGDRVVITNGSGQSSRTNSNLTGSFEGSLVGIGLSGAVLGYGISDRTASNAAQWQFITGAAAFAGPRQDPAAPYREGRVSDANGLLADFVRSYGTTDRPDEVALDAQGQVTAFSAPYQRLGTHATYSIGTAQVVQSGFDPETGMVWGRWGNGVAQVARAGSTDQVFLNNGASLHYIFAGTQSGPVALPLTGTATYDVIGSTSPTDINGHVGSLNSATLAANFTNRTVDASVNIGINGQTWTGSAANMPIYRDQYFSAYSGTPIAGLPNPNPLTIGCTPNCGQGAAGSFDGFFTGRTGQRAGLMYNLGGNQGAVAFGRRGG
ncbi:MAG TPA: FecR domain-containing protein [Usitatibacter sp.]|nr:FecR domain-containing protein [Usitatibacter sp.]